MKLKTDLFMWLKNIKGDKTSYLYWGYLIIIGVIFYTMNYYTPLFCDDWHYCFIFGTNTPIETISDIIKSQYIHYFEMNGRFIPHFFVQLFDGILGKSWFNISNTIMFIILLLLICKTISGDKRNQYYKVITLSTLCVFFLMPGFNYNFLWMSGACNYLWSAVLLLYFNIILQKDIQNKYLYPLLFIYGIICGWTHEGIVVGLASGYFIYYLRNQNELKPTSRKILLIGFLIGTAFLIFSPGSIQRAMKNNPEGEFNIFNLIRHIATSLTAMNNIILLPILIVLLFIDKVKGNICLFLRNNFKWIIAIIINFLLILLTKHDTAYSRFGFEFIAMLLIFKLIINIKINSKILHITNFIIILFLSIIILPISRKNFIEFSNISKQISQIKNKGIVLTTNIQDLIPYHLKRYFIHYYSFAYYKYYPPYDYWIQNYYSKESLIFLPREFMNDLQSHPEHYKQFYTTEKLPFYAIKLNSSETSINHVTYQLKKIDKNDIPFYHRPFAHLMSRYSENSFEVKSDYYSIITIENIHYLLVGKNKLIDNRLEKIIYE